MTLHYPCMRQYTTGRSFPPKPALPPPPAGVSGSGAVHYRGSSPPPSPETNPNLHLPLSPMQMSVDLERRHDLPINIDIRFPAVPCAVLR